MKTFKFKIAFLILGVIFFICYFFIYSPYIKEKYINEYIKADTTFIIKSIKKAEIGLKQDCITFDDATIYYFRVNSINYNGNNQFLSDIAEKGDSILKKPFEKNLYLIKKNGKIINFKIKEYN